jgi:hypothetical protein
VVAVPAGQINPPATTEALVDEVAGRIHATDDVSDFTEVKVASWYKKIDGVTVGRVPHPHLSAQRYVATQAALLKVNAYGANRALKQVVVDVGGSSGGTLRAIRFVKDAELPHIQRVHVTAPDVLEDDLQRLSTLPRLPGARPDVWRTANPRVVGCSHRASDCSCIRKGAPSPVEYNWLFVHSAYYMTDEDFKDVRSGDRMFFVVHRFDGVAGQLAQEFAWRRTSPTEVEFAPMGVCGSTYRHTDITKYLDGFLFHGEQGVPLRAVSTQYQVLSRDGQPNTYSYEFAVGPAREEHVRRWPPWPRRRDLVVIAPVISPKVRLLLGAALLAVIAVVGARKALAVMAKFLLKRREQALLAAVGLACVPLSASVALHFAPIAPAVLARTRPPLPEGVTFSAIHNHIVPTLAASDLSGPGAMELTARCAASAARHFRLDVESVTAPAMAAVGTALRARASFLGATRDAILASNAMSARPVTDTWWARLSDAMGCFVDRAAFVASFGLRGCWNDRFRTYRDEMRNLSRGAFGSRMVYRPEQVVR